MNRTQTEPLFYRLGILFCLLSVILGAFGAHALEARLTASGHLSTWDTAVRYQIWHALAIVVLSLQQSKLASRLLNWARALFVVGMLLFSGSLYWLALDGPGWLGPVTPLGGLSLIAGWAILLFALVRSDDADETFPIRTDKVE